jgi:hypothetical protein
MSAHVGCNAEDLARVGRMSSQGLASGSEPARGLPHRAP